MIRNFIGVLLSFFLMSCSHHLNLKKNVSKTSFSLEQFWAEQNHRKTQVSNRSGKLRLEMELAKKSLSGNGRFLFIAPDKMSVELRDPLGRLQYSLTSGGSEFTIYYPSSGTAYIDNQKGTLYLRDFLKLDLNFYELRDLWLGLLPEIWKQIPLESDTWSEEKGMREWSFHRKGDVLKLSVGEAMAVTDLEWTTQSGRHYKLSYEDMASCCDEIYSSQHPVSLARSVVLQNIKEGTSIELEWVQIDKAIASPAKDVFQVALPKGVDKLLLK